jgi:D-serine deaminase-like pyridoxal phosphate-dependent protein
MSEEVAMTGRALLVIADIGGYTPFIRLHRTSLAHAQDVVARLLEAMIDAAPRLTLLEVEGDAAFLYAWTQEGQEASTVRTGVDQMVAMYRAFHACQQHIAVLNTCSCGGCRQAGRLRVKFVAHLGDVAVQRVKHSAKLAGLDAILVHRMLKNAVPIPEYLPTV